MVRYHRIAAAVLLASSVLGPALQVTPAAADTAPRTIQASGTASLVSLPEGTDGGGGPELLPGADESGFAVMRSASAVGVAASAAQKHATNRSQSAEKHVVGDGDSADSNRDDGDNQALRTSFTGINHRDQRTANGGNQFSLEPPDQGLCVGNGFVLETVNDALRVFDTQGNPLTGVVALNTFYGYPPVFVRPAGPFGPEVTDPSCLFDAQTQRWFHVALTLDLVPTGPDGGRLTGSNRLDLAVSRTADPRDGWAIYRIPVQDDGTQGTPNHHCPPGSPRASKTNPNACIGDFPHIGADANGFYITTNEYALFGAQPFHAAQVYAFSKQALAANAANVAVTQIDTCKVPVVPCPAGQGTIAGKPGFTVWPATSPGTNNFEVAASGTEYFLSSMAGDEVNPTHTDNRLGVWALTNTKSLSSTPAVNLQNTIVGVGQYGVPAPSNQKAGSVPLADCINDTTMPTPFGPGCWQIFFNPPPPKHDEVEGPLDSSDSRMLSTVFDGSSLWGTLDTSVRVGGATRAGVAYYKVRPHVRNGKLHASLQHEGRIATANNNAIYGALAMTPRGGGALGITLVGSNHFPTAAYVAIDRDGSASPINIIAEGVGPQDGFTEYDAFSDPQDTPASPRWGDYGAAVVDGDSIWLANEWIAQTCTLQQYANPPTFAGFGSCPDANGKGTRTSLANWATRISRVSVGEGGDEGGD